MNGKNSLSVAIICGAIIFLTGIISLIISRDAFTLFISLAGVAVIAVGVVYYLLFRNRPNTDKEKALTEQYIHLYSGFAAKIGRRKVFGRKLRKLKSQIFKVCLAGNDVENRAFAVYLYYIHGMEEQLKKYEIDTVTDCLAGILARGNADDYINSLPEGMTLCDLVEKSLATL